MKPDKGNNNGNNNKRNIMGLVSIIFWALLFTMMIKSCTSSYANMGTVEVPYTTFKEWLANTPSPCGTAWRWSCPGRRPPAGAEA